MFYLNFILCNVCIILDKICQFSNYWWNIAAKIWRERSIILALQERILLPYQEKHLPSSEWVHQKVKQYRCVNPVIRYENIPSSLMPNTFIFLNKNSLVRYFELLMFTGGVLFCEWCECNHWTYEQGHLFRRWWCSCGFKWGSLYSSCQTGFGW